jgi:diguanylate cyclase (GGDEF)-like protein
VKVADAIRTNSRPTDYAIRFGGEEFDAILPATDAEGAAVYCDKIFKVIRAIRIPYGKKKLSVTVSAGISTLLYTFNSNVFIKDLDVKKSFTRLQKEADNALYEAKATGKNRWCVFDPRKADAYQKFRQNYKK